MNSKFSTAIVILGMILSITATSHIQRLENIKTNEFANDFIGQQIVDTVLLQQQTGGTADAVVRLLNGLVNDLKVQQVKSDKEHQQKNTFWANQLKTYRAEVARLTKLIASLETQILAKEKAIRLSKHNIKLSQASIALTKGKISALTTARKVDHAAFVKRTTRQTKMNSACQYIIKSLQEALKAGSFVQLNNIKESLATLQKENPLQALVQLTMTFNPKSVQFALTKIQEVAAGLGASIVNDEQHEKTAAAQYTELMTQFKAFLKSAEKQLSQEQQLLSKQEAQLVELKNQLKEAKASKKNYQGLIANVIATRKAYNLNYEQSKVKRSQEKVTIGSVIDIISSTETQSNRAEALRFTPKK